MAKQTKTKPTQDQLWKQMFHLMKTTNLRDDPEDRVRVASAGKVAPLRAGLILTQNKEIEYWDTHFVPPERITSLCLPQLVVGGNRVPLKECLKSIQYCDSRSDLKCRVSLRKWIGNVGVYVEAYRIDQNEDVLREKYNRIKNEIRADTFMQASSPFVNSISDYMFCLNWELPDDLPSTNCQEQSVSQT